MTIRRIVFLAAGLSALCLAPALAADLPPIPATNPVAVLKAAPATPAFTWTGFYAGANAGYGAQNTTQTNAAGGSDAFSSAIAGLVPANLSNEPRGPVAGGQFGYNYQWNWMLLSLEEQVDWANITNQSSTGSSLLATITGASSVSQNVDWISFTNVRLGVVPSQHFVTYATGGLAVGGVKTSASSSVTAQGVTLSGSQSLDQTRVGWDAGLGFEFAVNANWTLRADAKYYDLGTPSGSFTTNGAAGVAPLGINFSDPTKGYIGTVGLNWKF
jgi:outer membrane immunogenic protein